jgi:serine/threonine protein kinase/tetratricopeptide (TPR) repeat protein
MARMPTGQSEDGSRTDSRSAKLPPALVGGDIAEQRALGDVKRRLFGKTPEPVRIGRYELLQKVGSGGLGVVYLARDPELDRQVAIKLMRSGSSNAARHLARFSREARAMAQVSHPNVVEVFDVGNYDVPPDWPLVRETPPSGVFIAMAYVDGGSLRDWSAKPRSWRKLVDVLLAAGRGLAAAHAAGLCHRDFKPTNVLIGSDERPRVVDFGLARLVEHGSDGDVTEGGEPGTREPTITATGTVVGTPAYMAPEQHRGDPVGPPADQYAFCITAFEALYGHRPFPQKSEAALAIAKQDGEIALVRSTTGVPAAVQRVLLRGLASNPADRYVSMDALLAALDRAARGPLPRWAAATIPVLGLGAVGLLIAMHPQRPSQCDSAGERVRRAWSSEHAQQVEQAFAATGVPFASMSSARVAAELDGWAQAWLVAYEAACATATSDDVTFDRGITCLAQRLAQVETLVGAFVEADAGVVERSTALAQSVPPPAECLQARVNDGVPRPESPELLVGIIVAREQLASASTLRRAGRFADARKKASAVLVDAAAIEFDPLQAEALLELGACEGELGELEASERLISEAYYLAERSGYDRLSGDAASLLVGVLAESPTRFDEAHRWAEHARAALQRSGDDPGQRGRLLSVTGSMNFRAGRMSDAIADARAAEAIYAEIDPDGDAHATALANLGGFLSMAGQPDEAEPYLRRSLELREEQLGPDHPSVAQSVNGLSTVFSARGEHAQALELQQRALAIWEASLGPEHPIVAMGLGNVATTQSKAGDFAGAEIAARRALALRESLLAEDHVDVGFSRIALAEILLHREKLDEAASLAQRGLSSLTAAVGDEHQYIGFASIVLAHVESARGNLDAAREHYERAVTIVGELPTEPLYGEAHAGLGEVLLEQGDAATAVRELELAVEALAGDPSALPWAQDRLARALWHDPAQHDRARELARVALNGYAAATRPDAATRTAELRAWLDTRSSIDGR